MIEFEILATAYIISRLGIERPGLESRLSRKRLFFQRKILNSSNLNLLIELWFAIELPSLTFLLTENEIEVRR